MSAYQYRSITFMKTLGLCCQPFRVCNHKSTSPASKKNISARTFHFCLRFGFFPRNTAVSEFEHRTRCSFDCSSIGQVSARVWQGPAAAWEFRTAFHQAARWRRQITSDSQWQDFSHSVLPRFSVSLFSSSHFFFFFWCQSSYSSLFKMACSRFQVVLAESLFILHAPFTTFACQSKRSCCFRHICKLL